MSNELEEQHLTQVARWLPRLVVVGTLAGFVMLAWYAYRTGTQSISDEDLLIVEADKTPMKEKPADPGGMKFPNQDKTIFDTFAGNPQPPKVERIMPAPEEPQLKQLDTSETKTWINDKLYKKEEAGAAAAPEQVIGKPPAAVNTAIKDPAVPVKDMPKPSPIEAKRPVSNNVVSYTMDKSLALRAPQPAPAVAASADKPEAGETPRPEAKEAPAAKEEAAAPKPVSSDTGKYKVQLGAYGSEKEAVAAFSRMQKKFSILSGRDPIVVRADLGAKGVFYRLRVGGFADAAEAKKFCGGLKGQACIPAQ